jgi:AcrR family transcriptional regulator
MLKGDVPMEISKPTERACMDALNSLMQRKMLSRITVQDILQESGISKATFYRHYKDKDDLFKKMIRRDVNYIFTDDCNLDLWSVRVVQFVETLRQEQKLFYRLARSDPNAFLTFYTNVLYELFLKRLYRIHNRQFEVNPTLHRRFLFMCAGAAAVLQDWIMDACAESPESIAQEVAELIFENAHNSPLQNSSLSEKN